MFEGLNGLKDAQDNIDKIIVTTQFVSHLVLRNENLITSKILESNLPGFENLAGLILGFIESSFLRKSYVIGLVCL